MKASRPCSAQAQNILSSGSGDRSAVMRRSTNSASSLNRLMISPIRLRRTPKRLSTSLYSARISSLMSHVKIAFSSQSRRSSALGFPGARPDLNPAMPATRTEVSITPLRGFSRPGNSDLRQALFVCAIGADRLYDLRLCYAR